MKERIKKLETLIKVLSLVKLDVYDQYVCWAIIRQYRQGNVSYIEYKDTQQYVMGLIKPHGSVRYWLQAKGFAANITHDNIIMINYRKAWVKHMIQELKKELDEINTRTKATRNLRTKARKTSDPK